MTINFTRCALYTAILAVTFVTACQPGEQAQQGESEKFASIKLSEIFATVAHDEIGQARDPKQSNRKFLSELRGKTTGGVSNVFLVRGNNIDEAIEATSKVVFAFAAGGRIEIQESNKTWMVVYLGSGSTEPVLYHIDSVEQSDKTVRLSYHVPKNVGLRSRNIQSYYYWIPLAPLKSGHIQLEIWNTDPRGKELARRCLLIDKANR